MANNEADNPMSNTATVTTTTMMMKDIVQEEEERRFVDETDSLVLEVEDLDTDDWSDTGFPRVSLVARRQWRRTQRWCIVGLVLTTICIGIRQIVLCKSSSSSSHGIVAPSNDTSQSASTTKPIHPVEPWKTNPTVSPSTARGSTNEPQDEGSSSSEPQTTTTTTTTATTETKSSVMRAFSQLDPVRDLGLREIHRPHNSRPSPILQKLQEPFRALPTNAWYQNMLLLGLDNTNSGMMAVVEQPTSIHRAYVMPYVVDAAGPIPGLRLLPGRLQVGGSTTEWIVNENFGVTLGAMTTTTTNDMDRRYVVGNTTKLAVTLEWVRILENAQALCTCC